MRFNPVTFIPLGSGTVDIEVQKPTVMVAPSQVWLRAVNHAGLAPFEETGSVYDGAHHEYYHEWTMVGEPLSDWTKPTNLISTYNNPNKAYGREVAFLLPEPGDYTFQLVVTDRLGAQAVATTSTITVIDPLTHYNTSRRIYVDPDGDFTEVPTSDGSGAPKTATTIDSLLTQMATYTWNVNPPMILFRGGKTHSFNTRTGPAADAGWMKIEQAYPAQYLTSFGSGRASIVPATIANRDNARGTFEVWGRPVEDFLTFSGIDFAGQWDPTVERGGRTAASCIGFGANALLQNTFVLCHDITFSGYDKGLRIGAGIGTTVNNRMMVADCVFTNWRDYGTLGGHISYRYAYIGNRIAQHVDALHGGDRDDGFANTHNPLRIQTASYAYIAQNDFFSRQGWSTGGGNNRADQPCLRLLVDPEVGQSAHVERNCMEGGYQIINIEDAIQDGASDPEVPFNCVIENNLLVGTSKTMSNAIGAWRSGWTARNNIFIIPNVPQRAGYVGGGPAFRLEAPQNSSVGSADNPSNPIVIHNNTYLNLMNEPNAEGQTYPFMVNSDNYFTNVTEENNVVHKPSMTNSDTTSAPIDLSTAIAGFTPRFKGHRYGYDVAEVTLASDVANGGSFVVPYTSLLKVLQDGNTVDGGGATNQAYWQAIEGTDTRHAIWLRATGQGLTAEHGHISVSFSSPSGATITNNSGFTWVGGSNVVIHLDRTSLIPAMQTEFASPATIPLPRPQTGSAAIGAATSGRVTPKDALLVTRPVPRNSGALNTG